MTHKNILKISIIFLLITSVLFTIYLFSLDKRPAKVSWSLLIFLDGSISEERLGKISRDLSRNLNIYKVSTTDSEESLEEYIVYLAGGGDSSMIKILQESNPKLPASIELKVSRGYSSDNIIKTLGNLEDNNEDLNIEIKVKNVSEKDYVTFLNGIGWNNPTFLQRIENLVRNM